MLIIWKVRCWSAERDLFDRYFEVITEDLPTEDRFRLELAMETMNPRNRELLVFRQLFELVERPNTTYQGDIRTLFVDDYFEDESGKELRLTDIVRLKTGNPDLIVFPSSFRPHDIELATSDNSPIPENPVSYVRLTQTEVDALAYFVRDARELRLSKFDLPPFSVPLAMKVQGGWSSSCAAAPVA